MKINDGQGIVTSNIKSPLLQPSKLSNKSIASKTDYHGNAIRYEEVCSTLVLGSPSPVCEELDLHPHLLRVIFTVDTLIAHRRSCTNKMKQKNLSNFINNVSHTHLFSLLTDLTQLLWSRNRCDTKKLKGSLEIQIQMCKSRSLSINVSYETDHRGNHYVYNPMVL